MDLPQSHHLCWEHQPSADLRERDQPSHEMWIARRAQVEEEGGWLTETNSPFAENGGFPPKKRRFLVDPPDFLGAKC